jgi:hypothetical protein
MSRIRDIANILTAANVLSTDIETAAAITTAINALPPGYQRGNTASRPASPTVGDIYVNTQTGFVEIYESTGWSQVGAIASTVTEVTATNVGTSRAFNNGSASVAFTPGTVLGKTYTVTSSPGSYTASGSSSPVVVTGLQSSTQYTYTVVASNNYGTASASSASTGVTATTVPQAPTIGAVTGANAQASVEFTAGATGGSTITGYTVTSSPGNITGTGSSSPIVVTGLTNDTSYTFTVTATNANGTSAASSASSSVTPTALISIDYLVVAGGGGGGGQYASATTGTGGGGAGGFRTSFGTSGGGAAAENQLSVPIGVQLTVTVGAGGPIGGSNNGDGASTGFDSSISGQGVTTITSNGGGGASYRHSPISSYNGGPGGSGGGAASGNATGGAGTTGQGYKGGDVVGDRFMQYAASGGGAGSAGLDANGNTRSGGNGLASLITGSSVTYSTGGDNHSYTAGSQNRGNGGAGRLGGPGSQAGNSGGSGKVIIRASLAAASTTGSPVVTTPSGSYVYEFNSSGSITF